MRLTEFAFPEMRILLYPRTTRFLMKKRLHLTCLLVVPAWIEMSSRGSYSGPIDIASGHQLLGPVINLITPARRLSLRAMPPGPQIVETIHGLLRGTFPLADSAIH
jgi:hypothetical protein